MTDPLHVVIGVTGPMGAAVARALTATGQRVRGVNRSGRGDVPPGVELAGADIKDAVAARRACAGATIVYQCASAPYMDWTDLAAGPQPLRGTDETLHLPAITEGAIAGASTAGARLVYGDNHYMYGPVDGPLTEDHPWNARDAKGLARAAVARRLLDANASGEVAATIGCASDFFGPQVLNSTVGDRLFEPALRGDPVQIMGAPDQLHTYSFIDDVAAGLITLGSHDEALGQVWNLPSPPPVSPRRFYEIAYEAAGTRPDLTVGDDRLRESHGYEAHLMDRPFVVDHTRFATAFGTNVTPLREAIATTVRWFRDRVQD
jgi:nucleoside-diphosphate-sugar epimerase